MVLLGGAVVAAAVVWGRRGPLLRRRLTAPVRRARRPHRAVGDLGDRARAGLHRGGADVRIPGRLRRGRGRRPARAARRARRDQGHRARGDRGDRVRPGRARLAGEHRRERDLEPHRPAVRVLERRGQHSRARDPGPALARLPPRRQRRRPRGRLSGHGRRDPRHPAHAVPRRPGGRGARAPSPGSRSCRSACAACPCSCCRASAPASSRPGPSPRTPLPRRSSHSRSRRAWRASSACCSS